MSFSIPIKKNVYANSNNTKKKATYLQFKVY